MPTENTHEIRKSQRCDTIKPHVEHAYLLAAAVFGTFTLATWILDANSRINDRVEHGVRLLFAVALVGYFVRAAEARIRRTLDAKIGSIDRGRREAYAAGYVDGMAKRTPNEVTRLRAVD